MEYNHTPVLLNESVKYLITDKNGIYVDATIGGGGHASFILKTIWPNGFLIGCDKDRDAINVALKRLREFSPRFLIVKSDFRDLDTWLFKIGIKKVDGILADLGISSYHVNNKDRGFSFTSEVLPDMRMDQEGDESAWDVLNNVSLSTLIKIFKEYGEIKRARDVAIFIKQNLKNIKSAKDLSDLIKRKFPKRGKIHPATLVFQALRIYVNDELGALSIFLSKLPYILKVKGRVVIISYHSLEDRIVKNFVKDSPYFEFVVKKPIVPNYEEIRYNRRSRSAKMRVLELTRGV